MRSEGSGGSQPESSPPRAGKGLFPLTVRRPWGKVRKCGPQVSLTTVLKGHDTRGNGCTTDPSGLTCSHALQPGREVCV